MQAPSDLSLFLSLSLVCMEIHESSLRVQTVDSWVVTLVSNLIVIKSLNGFTGLARLKPKLSWAAKSFQTGLGLSRAAADRMQVFLAHFEKY